MEEERIWTLLSRKLTDEATGAEIAELNVLLDQHHELISIVNQISETWHRPVINDLEFMEATYLLHIARMREKGISFSSTENKTEFETPGTTNKTKRPLAYVALCSSILLIAFVVYYLFPVKQTVLSSKEKIALNPGNKKEIVTENGTRTKTILPDGTVVWLNAGSKISFDGSFAGPIRKVTLTGEAYFDVAKNPDRPFIVSAGNINVKALGTAFNIRSYPADKTIEATLLRGLVEITRQDDSKAKAIFLHPNQKLTVVKNGGATVGLQGSILPVNSYTISKIDVVSEQQLPETAWVFNRLPFKNEDFETLAIQMERWYNIKIVFEDDNVKKIHFNGSLENETVEQAFAALQMAVPFTYKINEHEVHISSVSR